MTERLTNSLNSFFAQNEILKKPLEDINEDVGFDVLKNRTAFMSLSKKKRQTACELFRDELRLSAKKYVKELIDLANKTLSAEAMDEIFRLVAHDKEIMDQFGVGLGASLGLGGGKLKVNGRVAETPYEVDFQKDETALILSLISLLACSKAVGVGADADELYNPYNLQKTLSGTSVKIFDSLSKRKQRKEERTIKYLCPQLNDVLKSASNVFTLPLTTNSSTNVNIIGMVDDVQLIPTKQQPKKLTFLGDDRAR